MKIFLLLSLVVVAASLVPTATINNPMGYLHHHHTQSNPSTNDKEEIVTIESTVEEFGTARGKVMTSYKGRNFGAFLSIPYAKKPIRFRVSLVYKKNNFVINLIIE